MLQVVQADAKIMLWLEGDYGEVIATVTDPHATWVMI